MTSNCEAFFRSLGKAVEADWAKANFEEQRLPEIAERHLTTKRPSDHITPDDIVDYMLFERERGNGASEADGEFGQPNINVFVGQRFYIEALFWLEGHTSIHQHGFSGAFHVMAGGSVHTRFEFTETTKLNDSFRLGHLREQKVELLRKGDIRPINRGSQLIHSLFHIDYPSVSIVVRTPNDPSAGVQFDYTPPGIARNPHRPSQFGKLVRRTVEMLRKQNHPRFREKVIAYLHTCEVREAYELLINESQYPEGEWVLDAVTQLGATPYAETLPILRAGLEEALRLRSITDLRTVVKERELRFVLGIILSSRSRETLFGLLKSAFPEADPKAKFLASLRRLAEMGIGFPENDSTIDLVDPLIDGASDEQVYQAMLAEYGPEVADAKASIFESCSILRRHPLLKTVVAQTSA